MAKYVVHEMDHCYLNGAEERATVMEFEFPWLATDYARYLVTTENVRDQGLSGKEVAVYKVVTDKLLSLDSPEQLWAEDGLREIGQFTMMFCTHEMNCRYPDYEQPPSYHAHFADGVDKMPHAAFATSVWRVTGSCLDWS